MPRNRDQRKDDLRDESLPERPRNDRASGNSKPSISRDGGSKPSLSSNSSDNKKASGVSGSRSLGNVAPRQETATDRPRDSAGSIQASPTGSNNESNKPRSSPKSNDSPSSTRGDGGSKESQPSSNKGRQDPRSAMKPDLPSSGRGQEQLSNSASPKKNDRRPPSLTESKPVSKDQDRSSSMTSPKTSPNAKTKVRDIREESRSPKKTSDSPTESTYSKSSKASTSSTHSSLDAPEGQQRLILRANFALPLGAEFCRFFPEWDVLKLMKQTGVLDWKPMEKFLRGLWVTTNYLKKPQKLKIRGLGRLQKREEDEKSEPSFNKNGNDKYMSVPGNANTLEFESKSGRISVAKYFKQQHRIKLVDPQAWLLDCGTRRKPTFIPAELARIERGQAYGEAFDELHKATDTKSSQGKAKDKKKTGNKEKLLKVLNLTSRRESTKLENGDITIDAKKFMVPGRILESPQVQCRTLVDKLQDGKPWNSTWNMNGREVHTSAAIPAWTILELGGAKGLDDQALVLTKASKLYRVEMGKAAVSTKPCGKSLQDNSFDQELGNVFKDLSKEIGLVMVILPKGSAVIRKATHAKVKRLGDLTYGLQTLCVQSTQLISLNDARSKAASESAKAPSSEEAKIEKAKAEAAEKRYYASLALKCNLKAGGINHILKDGVSGVSGGNNIMIVGIDLVHPSLKRKIGGASIAGVVANSDAHFAHWPGSVWSQARNAETVESLDNMIKERLEFFIEKSKGEPSEIIVYRTGVSDGQYQQVLDKELPMIKKGCDAACKAKSSIPITIIIVSQGHQKRFYPLEKTKTDGTQSDKTNQKVVQPSKTVKEDKVFHEPGTIVDRAAERGTILLPGWDFFLQAHAANINGNAKPTHYVVIKDEAAHSAKEIEEMTNKLCYMVGEVTAAVPVCAPAYYAGLICKRGKCYLANDNKWTGGVHEKLKDTMFYI